MKILLIGCGNMGKLLLQQWISQDVINEIVVVQPSLRAVSLFTSEKLVFVQNVDDIPDKFVPDIITIAIKPQQIESVLPLYQRFCSRENSITVSLAAAIRANHLKVLTNSNHVVRIMPNLAIRVRQSVNLCFGEAPNELRDQVNIVFQDTGKMIWLKSESQLDKLTLVSGCGPAYFFLLAKILSDFAEESGLEKQLANQLAMQTLIGSAQLILGGDDFEALISSVTSKGGVTEAVLKILRPGLADLMTESFANGILKLDEFAKY
jgi:pyrroline-5-carboxylate reductase